MSQSGICSKRCGAAPPPAGWGAVVGAARGRGGRRRPGRSRSPPSSTPDRVHGAGSRRGKSTRPERAILAKYPSPDLSPTSTKAVEVGLPIVEEPLARGAVDGVVEVAVGVGAVEEPAGDVVDAQAEPGARTARTERLARPIDRGVGDLPVDVEPVGIDGRGGDPVEAVAPGDGGWPGLGRLRARAEGELGQRGRLLLGDRDVPGAGLRRRGRGLGALLGLGRGPLPRRGLLAGALAVALAAAAALGARAVAGLVAGSAAGFTAGLAAGFATGLAAGFTAGLAAGFTAGLGKRRLPWSSGRPWAPSWNPCCVSSWKPSERPLRGVEPHAYSVDGPGGSGRT